MIKSYHYSLAFSFILLLVFSCKKERTEKSEIDNPSAKLSIIEAKKHYEQLAKQGSSKITTSSVRAADKTADFKNAFLSATPDASYVEVGLRQNKRSIVLFKNDEKSDKENHEILNGSIDRLIIKKEKATGVITEYIVTYAPSLKYLRKNNGDISSNYQNKLDNSFEGYIHYRSWDGTPLFIQELSKGMIVKTYNAVNKSSKSGNKIQSVACEEDCHPVYENVCNGSTCNWVYIGDECYLYCPAESYAGVNYNSSEGILEFTNMSAYENLLTSLEDAYELYNANFFDSREYMTDDQINAYAESIGFDEFKPLRDFEAHMGFSSLRMHVETETNDWLSVGHYDLSNLPDNNYRIDDEVEQTLLTTDGKVKIAGQTIQMNPVFVAGEQATSCIVTDRKIEEEGFGNSKVVRKKLMFDGYRWMQTPEVFIRPTAKGKAISFRRKSNGNLKKYATRMSVTLTGNVYESSDCAFYRALFDEASSKRRYRRKAKVKSESNNLAWKHNELRADMIISGEPKYIIY